MSLPLIVKICLLLTLANAAIVQQILPINCPSGTSLQPKVDFSPSYDGCGGNQFFIRLGRGLNPFTSDFNPCCNDHDICYQTCDTSGDNQGYFQACNDDFKSCLI